MNRRRQPLIVLDLFETIPLTLLFERQRSLFQTGVGIDTYQSA